MKNSWFFFLLLLFPLTKSFATDWQLRVKYDIAVDFDDRKHQFSGTQRLVVYNQSPDTLQELFFHLYYNAFQPGSMMDVRSRTIADPDRRVGNRISKLKPDEIGYHRIQSLKINGQETPFNLYETILHVPKAFVLPGDSAVIDMRYQSQVPVQIRRTGRNNVEGVAYSMAQWYPKLCNYDRLGWHPNPYIGREFYGIFGDWDVRITLPARYVVAATGVLQNADEIGHGYTSKTVKHKPNARITWHFKAENVHDFVWAADPEYVHKTHQVPGGPLLRFFFKPRTANVSTWEQLPDYMERFFQLMEKYVGAYPYPVYSFIQGGDGGMEYPMATLVLGSGELKGMVGLCVHEAAHCWFYGILGFNESLHHYMDEGFTTYVEDLIMNELFPPDDPLRRANPHIPSLERYVALARDDNFEPMAIHADHFNTNRNYGTAAYYMGSLLLAQLEGIIGREKVIDGLRLFYDIYKFKHPGPDELRKCMEKVSGVKLHWYFHQWINSTKTLKIAIKEVREDADGRAVVVIENSGKAIMPAEVYVEADKEYAYFIPLDLMYQTQPREGFITAPYWPWVRPVYELKTDIPFKDIKKVTLDKYYRLARVDFKNQVWPFK
ncbi:peptidase M1 [Thermaurantimonas aggregans]|uniref:Peptidase M1 n=1 Tax=Thermaurantimonas aggregans TaxID=2173829 RepID=A0A401XK62_9FLAO|nr:M1 family metallopeptidase [Thermaurantimonas aggregans]MCX8148534.1 M1 family metallopeptidase [Thermaurantimonas aggregans]GCD77392.1 peptidase M1 [Thermaurantimonas aggregans]